jgi:hypothetical protein
MRIYNAKKSQMDLPIGSNTRLTIPSHSVSKDIMPSDDFLTLVASTFDETEIALIVAGAFEINMCAKNPACTPLVCQSLDEAVERFNPAPKEVKKEEPKEEIKNPIVEEDVKEEEASVIVEEEVKESVVEEAVVEDEAQFPESEDKEEEEITPDTVDTTADEPMTEENSAVVDVKKKSKKKNRR